MLVRVATQTLMDQKLNALLVNFNNQSNQNDGSLLARFQRNDSLSRFLKERPQMHELLDKNIIRPVEHQRKIEREEIENKTRS